jgi:multiple sugar transport system permease protein
MMARTHHDVRDENHHGDASQAMTTSTAAAQAANRAAAPGFSLRRLETLWGVAFISPWIIGFILFTAGPMLASLYLSLTNYSITTTKAPTFVGLDNYIRIFTQDPRFWGAMGVTIMYAAIALPTGTILALLLAVLCNQRVPFVRLYRTIFYMPSVVPAVAAALIWQKLLQRDGGWINTVLEGVGIAGPNWLGDERTAVPALVIISWWGLGNAMIIYLAGIQGVPTELYEAARVDGANAITRFRRITLPMISPVILYNVVIGLINTFQYFTTAYVLTNGLGTPNYATYFYNMYLYDQAFPYGAQGYASALAWILLVVVLLITIIVFASSGRWVFYAGEQKR